MRFHGCCRKGRSKIKINDGFNGACSTIEHAICLLLDFWFYTKNFLNQEWQKRQCSWKHQQNLEGQLCCGRRPQWGCRTKVWYTLYGVMGAVPLTCLSGELLPPFGKDSPWIETSILFALALPRLSYSALKVKLWHGWRQQWGRRTKIWLSVDSDGYTYFLKWWVTTTLEAFSMDRNLQLHLVISVSLLRKYTCHWPKQ